MKREQAFSIIEDRRHEAKARAERTLERARQDAEFKSTEAALLCLDIEIAQKAALGEDFSMLEKEYAILKNRRSSILNRLSLSASHFLPQYFCKKCCDTGYFNGEYCSCAVHLLCDATARGSTLVKVGFKDFDPVLFPEGKQRTEITLFYKCLREITDKFPNTKIKNILVMGPTGVGKTHAISAFAHELTVKGNSVLYLTAFAINNVMRETHTDFSERRNDVFDEILSADMLIIDDLGTEPIFRNVTENYLYLIVNERMVNGLHTVISSNLDLASLNDRYGTRLLSRFTDKNFSLTVSLEGADIRRRGK